MGVAATLPELSEWTVIEKGVLNQDHRSCDKVRKIWPRES